jgi:hypothetical protein
MATTFTKIASSTVGSGGAATIVFSSIPSTYTDLLLVVSARSSAALFNADVFANINGNTTAQSWRLIQGNGATASSASSTADNGRIGIMPAASITANTFSNIQSYYPNYAGSTQKSYSSDSVMENNATLSYNEFDAGLNTNTTAITSITVASGNGNFVQYSTAYLYGIKNS